MKKHVGRLISTYIMLMWKVMSFCTKTATDHSSEAQRGLRARARARPLALAATAPFTGENLCTWIQGAYLKSLVPAVCQTSRSEYSACWAPEWRPRGPQKAHQSTKRLQEHSRATQEGRESYFRVSQEPSGAPEDPKIVPPPTPGAHFHGMCFLAFSIANNRQRVIHKGSRASQDPPRIP